VLIREWRLRMGGRTTLLRSLRFASLDDRHILGQALEVLPEDWSGEVMVEAIVDGAVALARFWGSRAERGADGRWHIYRVIGPDEYHEGVDDNAYTNRMPAWLLDRASQLAAWLSQRHQDRWRSLTAALGLDDAEPASWSEIAAGLVRGLDPETGLIEQHRGFHQLQEIDLATYASRSTTMDVVLGWERLEEL
jgi:trehalose/maltose hydrolase-like predicted phosphorylase